MSKHYIWGFTGSTSLFTFLSVKQWHTAVCGVNTNRLVSAASQTPTKATVWRLNKHGRRCCYLCSCLLLWRHFLSSSLILFLLATCLQSSQRSVHTTRLRPVSTSETQTCLFDCDSGRLRTITYFCTNQPWRLMQTLPSRESWVKSERALSLLYASYFDK